MKLTETIISVRLYDSYARHAVSTAISVDELLERMKGMLVSRAVSSLGLTATDLLRAVCKERGSLVGASKLPLADHEWLRSQDRLLFQQLEYVNDVIEQANASGASES